MLREFMHETDFEVNYGKLALFSRLPWSGIRNGMHHIFLLNRRIKGSMNYWSSWQITDIPSGDNFRHFVVVICFFLNLSNAYAFDNEEHEAGIISGALPILSHKARVFGCVSVTSTTARHNLVTLAALVPRIQKTVEEIAKEVQIWRFPEQIPASA